MKKIYLQPETTIYRIEMNDLVLSGSITGIGGVDDLEVSDEDTDESGITSGNVRGNIWDWDF